MPTAPPLALTAEFGTDAKKVTQWRAFLNKGKLDAGGAELDAVCEFLAGLLMPVASSVAGGEAFDRTWAAGGPWGASE